MNWKSIILPSVYLALFALTAFAVLFWDRRKRGTRVPFAQDLRLLRGPGESQLKAVAKLDEEFVSLWLLTALAPCLLAMILLVVIGRLNDLWVWLGLGVILAILVAALAMAVRWLLLRLQERSDRYLGYFGARVVAEHLEPMTAFGWKVFHDVPCETGKEKFTISHVAIGPSGIFAIETRTRRKEGAREGHDDYKVFFDGEQLTWPWGEDQYGIGPAIGNAKWLQNWLDKTTGVRTTVVPVLALPGWYVEAKAQAAVRVVNPSWLPDILHGGGEQILGEKQIEHCARQLEQRCRNVEY